jgi:hypothetical protein
MTGERIRKTPGVDVHTSPEAEDRAERAANNPALARETVLTAERRARQGWPWPVSGDDTAKAKPARVRPAFDIWKKAARGRKRPKSDPK